MTFQPTLKSEYRYWEMSMYARTLRFGAQQDDFWRLNWPGLPMEGPPTAQCGYYKMRRTVGTNGQRWVPVGIWISEGVMQAAAGGPVDPLAVWPRCNRNPISWEDYTYAVENGKFKGEVEAELPRLNNYADDPNADYREQMVSLLAKVEAFLSGLPDPVTDEGANELANFSALVSQSQATAKGLLDVEIAGKKAEIQAQKEVWSIPMAAATDIAARIKKIIGPILIAKKARGEEARLGGQGTGVGRTRRIGVRTAWKARIDDWDLAFASYVDHPQVRELIQTLADAAARSKEYRQLPMDGITFYEKDVV